MDCSGIFGTGLLGCPETAPRADELGTAVLLDAPGIIIEAADDAGADDCPGAGLVGDGSTDAPVAPATGQIVV